MSETNEIQEAMYASLEKASVSLSPTRNRKNYVYCILNAFATLRL